MLRKRGLPEGHGSLPPAQRLRANVLDLVSRNEVSGSRGASLINDMAAAGAAGVCDLVSSEKYLGNVPRSFRRKFRRSGWPPLYACMVRCWNQTTQAE